MEKHFCILFAGVVGSSKTPIAYYLSSGFQLPILNKDSVRIEVIEDLGYPSEEEAKKRFDERVREALDSKIDFILDASIDRSWTELKQELDNHQYNYFIISLDLSEDFLTKLLKQKGYTETLTRLNGLIDEHQRFLDRSSGLVSVTINDKSFPQRLQIAEKALSEIIKK